MSLELTFKSVCATVKKQGQNDPELIQCVDNLLGLTLICSPLVAGPAAIPFLPLLGVKNEVVKIGKYAFEKLSKKKDEDYLQHYETMRTAYGLLVFTSFFDALDFRLPEGLRKEIAMLDTEKTFLAKDAAGKMTLAKGETTISEPHDAPISNSIFPFPHPTETLDEQCQRQAKLWKQMGQGFVGFVQKLRIWEDANEEKRTRLLSGLEKIEEEAAKRFEAQYFELARKFEDFAVWANLQAHKGTKALIGELSDYVKSHAKLSRESSKAIDVGFEKLHDAVLSIPETLRIEQATEIAESLNKFYQARINDSIINDEETGGDGKARLSFPKVCDAFIPQAFRVTRQARKFQSLEDESRWSGLPRRNDLGAFLLSYLSSPYSTETPLLILGHPGSGKSLLTTILPAQLMSKHFTAIRVPLREVNADADIVTQIEDTIRQITKVSTDSWIKVSALFKNCPPLVILDGYDELLQASGQVFASYVKDAQRLQAGEAEQGRPVRIIITSRVTLIDKAVVPVGTTILRLLEFDQDQRDCWSGIWNKANAAYFRDTGTERFTLPSKKEKGSEKILTLAEQPLLLLMLALYDSQGNQLRNSGGLDRTRLYDSLLRRFVIREREKEKSFVDAEPKERDKVLSEEMQRLGAAALGMYNRQKVHILSHELDDDLSFFQLERDVASRPGKALSQAYLLLGSFFFVHKSQAQHRSGAEDAHEEAVAFEFLHNTFSEFLTADFILRRAVAQVLTLRAAESNEALRSVIDKMMGTANGFERDWFASLVYTPLFTRPVVMEMIREWAPHVLRDKGLSEEDFVKTLEKIVLNQIQRMLNKREMPPIMRKETAQEGYTVPFGDHPLVGHIAIYSINLILLRLIVGKHPFVFDESKVDSYEDGTRPWDRLMHIWRSWFSLGNLNGLTAVMLAQRTDSKITVTAKSKFQAVESTSRLQAFFNVALSLGDNVSAGVAGLHLFDPIQDSEKDLNDVVERLGSEGIDVGPPLAIARLLVLAQRFAKDPDEFVHHARSTLAQTMEADRWDQVGNVCLIIARVLGEQIYTRQDNIAGRVSLLRSVFEPRLVAEIALKAPSAARIIFDLGKELRDFEWIDACLGRFLDVILHEMPPSIFDSEATTFANWVRLLREVGVGSGLSSLSHGRRFPPGFFKRMFDPRRLLELSEWNQELALAYLQMLRELGGGWYFDESAEQEVGPEFFERVFNGPRLLELGEWNPKLALAYLQMLREVGGGRYFEEFVEREMGPELFEHILNPRQLLELSEWNPEAALGYLQMLRKMGGGRYFVEFVEREIGPEFFDRLVRPRHLLRVSELSVWLACTRLFESERFNRMVIDAISEGLLHQSDTRRILSLLPITSLADLRWLGEQTQAPELRSLIAELLE